MTEKTSSNHWPKISIVMPSYNQATYIEQAIKSILDQHYPNLELIVMDGGSKDGTIEILKQYSNSLIWTSQKDNGQAHAINLGLEKATGEILAYLNADDFLEPGCLEAIAGAFKKHPKALWVTGRCNNVDQRGVKIRGFVSVYKNVLLEFRSLYLLIIVDFIAQPATFWHRSLMEEVGRLDESLHYNLDYDLFLKFMKKARPSCVRKHLANFRIHNNAKTASSSTTQQYIDEDKTFIRCHTANPLLLFLHDLHRWLITIAYARLR